MRYTFIRTLTLRPVSCPPALVAVTMMKLLYNKPAPFLLFALDVSFCLFVMSLRFCIFPVAGQLLATEANRLPDPSPTVKQQSG